MILTFVKMFEHGNLPTHGKLLATTRQITQSSSVGIEARLLGCGPTQTFGSSFYFLQTRSPKRAVEERAQPRRVPRNYSADSPI